MKYSFTSLLNMCYIALFQELNKYTSDTANIVNDIEMFLTLQSNYLG